ncbi:MAG: restriction endonuclease subunit S [Dysgonamonadaceae bacterium]|jgi:type I restriction enzyme S subunit|nr:restriction endonuclease subunit S [Dysgonamonadaceae bacterium]
MNPYPKYKTTNIPWLQKVPEGWDITRIKHICSEIIELNEQDEGNLLSVSQYTGVTEKKNKTDKVGMHEAESLIGYKKVKKDNLVMNIMLAWNGSLGISQFDGIVSPAYAIFKFSDNCNPWFFHYLFRTLEVTNYFKAYSTGVVESRLRLYPYIFLSLSTIKPSLIEQNKIVRFLDVKVSAIDRLIEAKRRRIELLKEWKRAAINEEFCPQITHINAYSIRENQRNLRTKIEEGVRFRTLFSLGKGLNITKADLKDEGIPCVNYGEIHSKYGFEVNPETHRLRCVDENYFETNPQSLLNNGDFVFADTSEDIAGSGNFTFLNSSKTTFAGYHTIIARPKQKMNSRFVAYLFDSDYYREQIQKEVSGVKVFSITRSILNDTIISLPAENIQQQIVKKLDAKCSKADNLLAKLQDEISLFTEYKTRLINDVVTGKVDVQNSVATSVIKSVVTQAQVIDIVPKQSKSHSKGYEDAVILAALVNAFGTEQHPFTAFDCQKFPYLLHRQIEGVAANYNKFAAGPYNPELKYKTARPIALKKKYVKEYLGQYKGFVADKNAPEAMKYFTEWYGNEPLEWIKQFRFIKNRKNELELLTTVDMAIVELRENSRLVTMLSVKDLKKKSPAWKDKLARQIFSDDNIERAIKWSYKLFGNN